MKNYVSPEIEIMNVVDSDVITTSPGVESPDIDLGFGW
jgi:hypothetical protein